MIAQATTRMLGGPLGLSDDAWAGVLQLLGVAVSVYAGWRTWPRRLPVVSLIALGVLIDVIAEIFIAGGGPSGFVGFVCIPVEYLVVAFVTQRAVRAWKRWRVTSPA